jgi:hypothetical protein
MLYSPSCCQQREINYKYINTCNVAVNCYSMLVVRLTTHSLCETKDFTENKVTETPLAFQSRSGGPEERFGGLLSAQRQCLCRPRLWCLKHFLLMYDVADSLTAS